MSGISNFKGLNSVVSCLAEGVKAFFVSREVHKCCGLMSCW